jgi:hypothetical protein
MVLVIGVENDIFVRGEVRGNCLLESPETSSVRNGNAAVTTEVLSRDSCSASVAVDILYHGNEPPCW